MAPSDRLNLLSLVTLMWIALVGALVLLASVEDSPEPPPSALGEPYYFDPTPEFFAGMGLLLLSWFASWGLISVAILGRGTTVRGWRLRTGLGDVLILAFGSFVWSIVILAVVFKSVLVSLVILSILPVAILIGLVNLLWGASKALQHHINSASSGQRASREGQSAILS